MASVLLALERVLFGNEPLHLHVYKVLELLEPHPVGQNYYEGHVAGDHWVIGLTKHPLNQLHVIVITVSVTFWWVDCQVIPGYLVVLNYLGIVDIVNHLQILLVCVGHDFLFYYLAHNPSFVGILAVDEIPNFEVFLLYVEVVILSEWKVVFYELAEINTKFEGKNVVIFSQT